jgi:hypothetical protein
MDTSRLGDGPAARSRGARAEETSSALRPQGRVPCDRGLAAARDEHRSPRRTASHARIARTEAGVSARIRDASPGRPEQARRRRTGVPSLADDCERLVAPESAGQRGTTPSRSGFARVHAGAEICPARLPIRSGAGTPGPPPRDRSRAVTARVGHFGAGARRCPAAGRAAAGGHVAARAARVPVRGALRDRPGRGRSGARAWRRRCGTATSRGGSGAQSSGPTASRSSIRSCVT